MIRALLVLGLLAGAMGAGWIGNAAADCRAVAVTALGRPVIGIEDLAVDEALGRVVLSAYDRRAAPEKVGGGLFLLPLAALAGDRAEAVELTSDFRPAGGFRPHGMDLRAEADGSRSLLVVNRRWDARTVVERFTLSGSTLRHRDLFEEPRLCRANDVALLDGDRFLFTADHGGCGWVEVAAENMLNLHRGYVGLVEGGRLRVVAAGIGFPNGLLPDPAADRLYVAATREQAVLVYRLSALLTGEQALPLGRIAVPGGPDNLGRAADGRVLAAVHPSLFGLALHRYGWPEAGAPTRIVALDEGGAAVVAEDDGSRLPAATVAAGWGGGLIAGSATSDRLLVCGDGSNDASRSSDLGARAAPK